MILIVDDQKDIGTALERLLRYAGHEAVSVTGHGGGIGLLVKDMTDHADDVARLIKEGVRFAACENTLRDQSIPKENLLPDVTTVASGAVEVIRKQEEGFGYFKP